MRLRLKFKIIDDSLNLSQFDNVWPEVEGVSDLKQDDESNSVPNKTYDSFESLIEDFDRSKFKNDLNDFNKIQRLLRIYDEKSKKIIFPFDQKNIKSVSQLKTILNNYLNLSYYNLRFLNPFANQRRDFTYEVQVTELLLDKYSLCEDFYVKDLLKDNDKLEVCLKIIRNSVPLGLRERSKEAISKEKHLGTRSKQNLGETSQTNLCNKKRNRDSDKNAKMKKLSDSESDSAADASKSSSSHSSNIRKKNSEKQIKKRFIFNLSSASSDSDSSESVKQDRRTIEKRNEKINKKEDEGKNKIKKEKDNFPKIKQETKINEPRKPNEFRIFEDNNYKKEELVFVKKPKNNINNIQNENNFYKNPQSNNNLNKKINSKKPDSSKNNFSFKAEKEVQNKKVEDEYTLIPTENLEKLTFLRKEFPELFIKDNKICFRLYEILEETGDLGVSKYKFGIINEFIEDTKNFLIEIDNDSTAPEPSSMLLVDEYEPNIICVHLRDFVELRIKRNENHISNDFRNEIANESQLSNKEIKDNEVNLTNESKEAGREIEIPLDNSTINKLEKETDLKEDLGQIDLKPDSQTSFEKAKTANPPSKQRKETNGNKGNSIFNRIIMPQIRKQIEFYFSDKNYYHDAFLLEKASENPNHFIDLKIIMGFNKIKSITSNPEDVFNALKDSEYVEFNEEKNMIKKKNIFAEFLNS